MSSLQIGLITFLIPMLVIRFMWKYPEAAKSVDPEIVIDTLENATSVWLDQSNTGVVTVQSS